MQLVPYFHIGGGACIENWIITICRMWLSDLGVKL